MRFDISVEKKLVYEMTISPWGGMDTMQHANIASWVLLGGAHRVLRSPCRLRPDFCAHLRKSTISSRDTWN